MNRRKVKKLTAIILLFAVLAAVVTGGHRMIVMSRLSALTLQRAKWSCGGGMSGGHTSLEIKQEGDRAVAVAEKQEWHNSDLERTTYVLPKEVLTQIKDLIVKNKINALSRRGYSEDRALDADIDHFYANFAEGYSFGISQEQKKTPAESRRFYEVRTFMYDLIKGAEGVTEIVPAGSEPDADENGSSSASNAFSNFRKLCEPMI